MKYFYIVFILLYSNLVTAQFVVNGDFASGTSSWGCSPETNPESVYGGSGGNSVAEVDAAAGLCQTISGLTVGSSYQFSITYSRRTGGCPGPNPAGANITFGSNLSATISSTVAVFTWQTSVFTFTASQASANLNIAANFGGTTCGLILDNIGIVLYSGLPIELLYFTAVPDHKQVVTGWATATQLDNDFFSIERSADAIDWETIQTIPGAGTFLETKYYTSIDSKPLEGLSYYRLKQTDYGKKFTYSPIVSVDMAAIGFKIYPNPAEHMVFIDTENDQKAIVTFINSMGQELPVDYERQGTQLKINTSFLEKGIYTLKLQFAQKEYRKRIAIEKGN